MLNVKKEIKKIKKKIGWYLRCKWNNIRYYSWSERRINKQMLILQKRNIRDTNQVWSCMECGDWIFSFDKNKIHSFKYDYENNVLGCICQRCHDSKIEERVNRIASWYIGYDRNNLQKTSRNEVFRPKQKRV